VSITCVWKGGRRVMWAPREALWGVFGVRSSPLDVFTAVVNGRPSSIVRAGAAVAGR
jgi:hypothetical protein